MMRNISNPASYSQSGYQAPQPIPKYAWIDEASQRRTREGKDPCTA